MRKVYIDCDRLFEDRRSAHVYLAEQFDFPEYYGKNLDALYDCLGELGRTEIILLNFAGSLGKGGYGEMIIRTVFFAAETNPRIRILPDGENQNDGEDKE